VTVPLRRARRICLVAGAAYALLLFDWSGRAHPGEPRPLHALDVSAVLKAGAARVPLAPPLPVMRPSFRYPVVVATREQDPLEMRALVLRSGGRTVALVLADLMVITDDLRQALERSLADLRLDGLVFVATHTHSSVSGFDSHVAAQVLGLGPFRPDIAKVIVDRAAEAVREAERSMVRVQLRSAETRIRGWAWNRSTPGADVDDLLTAVALDSDAGMRVATVAVVAAHPTLFPSALPELSADYPGVAMRLLEEGGGVALLLQGAEGDAAAPLTGWIGMQADGAFVAAHVRGALHDARAAGNRLAFSEVEIELPGADVRKIGPFLLRRPLSNLLARMLPRTARVGALTLGDVLLLTVAGEPTALAAQRMLQQLPRHLLEERKVRVVALAQAYVSYIDAPERVRDGTGESRRAWYGPDLWGQVSRGLEVAVEAPRSNP